MSFTTISLNVLQLEVSFDEAGVDFIFDEKVVGEDVEAGGYRCFDWFDNKFPQSPFHSGNGFSSRSLMDNELGNHRIVAGRDGPALMDVCIDSDAGAAWQN